MTDKLWSGRFQKKMAASMEAFSNSLQDDEMLIEADIRASIAYAKALKSVNLLNNTEFIDIEKALKGLLKVYQKGEWSPDPSLEDIHMNIETYLIDTIGETGKKIHAGRSRNDQVVTALKLTLQTDVDELAGLTISWIETLIEMAQRHMDIILPGYTHLQQAQPILLSHYFMAYAQMFYRDLMKLIDVKGSLLSLPLGAGALAGNPFSINRQELAEDAGFMVPTENSIDSISDRDYVIDCIYTCTMMMLHVSRFSEDMILWNSVEFGFITLSDEYSTGSSMMPQKKNPDLYELSRGKTGRVVGDLMNIMTTVKGLPLGYNRDLQEDKNAVFDALKTVKNVIQVQTEALPKITVNKQKIEQHMKNGFLLSTDLADYLVRKGMTFRDAHQCVGSIVSQAVNQRRSLTEYTVDELKQFSKIFDNDVKQVLNLKSSIDRRNVIGGTAVKRVKDQINTLKKKLKEVTKP